MSQRSLCFAFKNLSKPSQCILILVFTLITSRHCPANFNAQEVVDLWIFLRCLGMKAHCSQARIQDKRSRCRGQPRRPWCPWSQEHFIRHFLHLFLGFLSTWFGEWDPGHPRSREGISSFLRVFLWSVTKRLIMIGLDSSPFEHSQKLKKSAPGLGLWIRTWVQR